MIWKQITYEAVKCLFSDKITKIMIIRKKINYLFMFVSETIRRYKVYNMVIYKDITIILQLFTNII